MDYGSGILETLKAVPQGLVDNLPAIACLAIAEYAGLKIHSNTPLLDSQFANEATMCTVDAIVNASKFIIWENK